MAQHLHVLHIARWYPYEEDPMFGLFLQRQVKALSGKCANTVIFVWPSRHITDVKRTEQTDGDGLREIRVFFPAQSSALRNATTWLRHVLAEARALLNQMTVHVIHAHMLTRAAYAASLLSREFAIPYVISEHWSRYFPQSRGYPKTWELILAKRCLKKSAGLICVSQPLQLAMKALGLGHSRSCIIPNVVDTSLFRHGTAKQSAMAALSDRTKPVVMVHLSCFDEHAKNINALIDAMALLKREDLAQNFRISLFGNGSDRQMLIERALALGLSDVVLFPGEIPPEQVAHELAQADFLIQTSRYETFSVAVVEAWASGVPVVSTPVGVYGEYQEAGLGLTIHGYDGAAVAHALKEALKVKGSFDPSRLCEFATIRFSGQEVGRQLLAIYSEVVHRHQKV